MQILECEFSVGRLGSKEQAESFKELECACSECLLGTTEYTGTMQSLNYVYKE